VTLSCTPLSLAEVARRRRAAAFSSPSARDTRAERDENEQDQRQDEVMA
jgi:hypothetical protein